MNLDLEQLTQDVIDGIESPLKAWGILSDLEKLVKKCKEEVSGAALKEAEQYNEKTFRSDGYIFERKNGGKRFDFKQIEEWNAANEQLKKIEARHKQAYENYTRGLAAIDPETGEVIELPKVSFSKDSLIMKAFE